MITKYSIYLESSMGIGNEYKVGDIVNVDFAVGIINRIGLNYVEIVTAYDVDWHFGIGYIKPATAEEIEEYYTEVEQYKLEQTANKYNL